MLLTLQKGWWLRNDNTFLPSFSSTLYHMYSLAFLLYPVVIILVPGFLFAYTCYVHIPQELLVFIMLSKNISFLCTISEYCLFPIGALLYLSSFSMPQFCNAMQLERTSQIQLPDDCTVVYQNGGDCLEILFINVIRLVVCAVYISIHQFLKLPYSE